MSSTLIAARSLLAPQSQAGRALRKVHLRADRIMAYLVGGHVLIAISLCFFYQTWAVALPIALLAAGMYFISAQLLPGQLATRCLAGLSLQIFCMLYIYQMHGMAEMHFFFFTSCTAMIIYQDKWAIWPGVILIIIQHLVFAIAHNNGYNVFYYEGLVTFTKLFFHFSIVAAAAVGCSYVATILHDTTLRDADQRDKLLERNHQISLVTKELEQENERRGAELAQARALQESIMGAASLQLAGYQMEGLMETCSDVGGDYYDYKKMPDGSVIVAIGDATGHGMRAAIVVAACKAVFQSQAANVPLPELFRQLSKALQGLGLRGTYMGLTLLHLRDEEVELVTSGMPPTLLVNASGQVERLNPPGPFIGFLADSTAYPHTTFTMQPGELLLAYTDGLNERFNAKNAILGWESVGQWLLQLADDDIKTIPARLLANASAYNGTGILTDDTTVVAIRRSAALAEVTVASKAHRLTH